MLIMQETKSKESYNSLLPWFLFALGSYLAFVLAPVERLLPVSPFLWIFTGLAAINWLYFFIGAVRAHRQTMHGQLIESGVYAYVRHPIYSANVLLAWGVFLAWPFLPLFLSVLWLMAVLSLWIRLEEAHLSACFGESYEAYRRRVPPFVPRYFHQR